MSGIKVSFSLFSTNLTGQDLYTGGVFGSERSILILCVVFILTVVLLQRACREELAHKGDWLFWYQKNAQGNQMHFLATMLATSFCRI